MFTIDTLVDHNTKTAKQAIAHLPNEEVRGNFEILIDAQAAYTKTVFSTATDLFKMATDQLAVFAPTKPVAKK